jgi:hypothetical protein
MAHLTSRQIVDSKGISLRTLLRMVDAREIVPAEKLPGETGAYLFDPEEVERAFRERERRHNEDVPA